MSVSSYPLLAVRLVLHACITFWLIYLVYASATGQDGPDPIKALALSSGEAALILLFASLAIRPAKQFFRKPALITLRRPLGLWAFAVMTLHLLVFTHGYLGWQIALLFEELNERPYILAGSLAWLLLVPLAITSTRGWQRKLGLKWKRLHASVYLAGCLVCAHIIWQVRSDWIEAGIYTLIYVLILGSRYQMVPILRRNR